MKTQFAPKLQPGDEIRILALARSAALIDSSVLRRAEAYFAGMGLKVTYGEYARIAGRFGSAPTDAKLADLHTAFADPQVKGIVVAIGGFNSNQLLDRIDWGLIGQNPKVFAGFSDITVLNNAIFARTGLVTYAAPNFYVFGLPPEADYSVDSFRRCVMDSGLVETVAADYWYDYPWQYDDIAPRERLVNDGPKVLVEGQAEGTVLGGNLCSFSLLNGTSFFPEVDGDIILTLEDDSYDSIPVTFERNLQSAIQQPYFRQVKGILIGRFQSETKFTPELLKSVLRDQPALRGLPIACNLDFGHTDPKFTYPIGGKMTMDTRGGQLKLAIIEH